MRSCEVDLRCLVNASALLMESVPEDTGHDTQRGLSVHARVTTGNCPTGTLRMNFSCLMALRRYSGLRLFGGCLLALTAVHHVTCSVALFFRSTLI